MDDSKFWNLIKAEGILRACINCLNQMSSIKECDKDAFALIIAEELRNCVKIIKGE